ncbi:hypothetical protein CLU79DRAFT_694915 [Phycomyces nitens]|nr:hypothetical protein CLU79DRAFT_694915 [Phycomyces nitens]
MQDICAPIYYSSLDPSVEFQREHMCATLSQTHSKSLFFFHRPGFEKAINSWNRGSKVDGMLFNVYNSIKWNELLNINAFSFVGNTHSLMLTLNID